MSAEDKGIIERQVAMVKKKVAIIGFAGSKDEAPYKDESFEIWGLNDLYAFIPRWTRWFQIHDPEKLKGVGVRTYDKNDKPTWDNGGDQYSDLAKLNCPVYMWQHYEDVPNSVEYPLQKMLERFGTYFTNSISYMLAFAIDEGFDVIHLYGVDMAMGSEYEFEKPSVEYFLGLARGMGIDVYVPETSTLLKSMYLYGYEDRKVDNFLADCNRRTQFMMSQRAAALELLEKNRQTVANYDGALEDLKHVKKVWAGL